MGSMSIIEGNELLLRHLTKQDLNDFTALVTDPLYGKFSPLGKITEEVAATMVSNIVENYQKSKYEFWVVVDKLYGALAGFVGYHPVFFENKLQEMYFVGFYTKYWGSKFPQEATWFVCDYAFNKEQIPRLISFVHPNDTTALMCAQIMEAKFEKQALFLGAPLFLFSTSKQDFAQLNIHRA